MPPESFAFRKTMMPRFSGKVAVVTGSGSGIGEACARRLASEGASVVIADLDERAARRVASGIEASQGRAIAVPIDVANSEEVERMLDATGELGGIDILVNNVGVLRLGLIVETSDEDWEFTIRTNLSSVFYCARGAARRMIEQGRGGRIVSISSIHAVLSEPNGGPYTASKGGIEALSRTLASELAPHKITVNCVRPGATWTNLSRPLYTEQVLQALNLRIPLKEIAQPDWIASAVVWFASEEACYCTGTTLDVDGGYIMDGSLAQAVY
jgi:NAD(P)-dependent dehydrogenase (short-subunit alcohol dehydrogenase family)